MAIPTVPRTATPTADAPRSRFSLRTFESLGEPNYRWFLLSLFGHFSAMNMQQFARGYLIFEMTGSYAMLSLVSLANAIPGIIFSLLGGVLADAAKSKKRVVQIAQALNIGISAWNAFLLTFGLLRPEHLIIAAALQGAVMSGMMPARQVLTNEVVGFNRLMNALALNNAAMNVARLFMPALGGLLVAWIGGGVGGTGPGVEFVFHLMTVMYVISFVALFGVRVVPGTAPTHRARRTLGSSLGEIGAGLSYIAHDRLILVLLLVNMLAVMGSMPYFQLLPGFAKEVLDLGPGKLGVLMSVQGIGSLTGSLVIASMPSRRRGLIFLASSILLGVSLVAFVASTIYIVSLVLIVIVGVGQAGRMSLSQVLVQHYSADEYRGRVQSVYMMEMSLVQFGTFGVGLLANVFGPQWAIGTTAGVMVLVVTLVTLTVPRVTRLD